jgi:glycosyltransferase involved in cell wall biosynthesis
MADQARNGPARALFIAPIIPSDRGNGLAMRTGFLLDTYARRFAIDLAVAPVVGGTKQLTPFVDVRVRRTILLPVAAPDTHYALVSSVADPKARLAAFRQYGRPSITSALGVEVERALRAFVGDTTYALVHVSRLYLASLAAPWMQAGDGAPRVVLDCDEDDVSAYRRFARLHRIRGQRQDADWEDAEAEAFRSLAGRMRPRFDLLLAASAGEAVLLRARAGDAEVEVVPNVVPAGDGVRWRARRGRQDVLFVGNMSYLPNVDAVMWFAKRIWPQICAAVPYSLRFVIAGYGAPKEVRNLASQPGIVLSGGFADPAPVYRRAALAVVPIRAGGGTRIKLLESAKFGVPIVATRFGAEGTGFRSGQELLLADTEGDFAGACARLLTDLGLASRLAAAAQRKLRRDHDGKCLGDQLLDRIDGLIATEATR